MAFKKLKVGKIRSTGPVRIGTRKSGRQYVLVVYLSSSIIESMEWLEGIELELALGSGKDANTLRIQNASEGFKLCKVSNGGGYIPINVCRFESSRNVEAAQHISDKGALFVTLPVWCAEGFGDVDD